MTHIEQAIRDAIEKGGYERYAFFAFNEDRIIADLEKDAVLLDPSFWQALGKALKWKHFTSNAKPTPSHKSCSQFCNWKAYWHRFIDHLAEGKDAEPFFASLTNKDTDGV